MGKNRRWLERLGYGYIVCAAGLFLVVWALLMWGDEDSVPTWAVLAAVAAAFVACFVSCVLREPGEEPPDF